MSTGLATTFDVLTQTENEAAVRVLILALDSPSPAIQEGAIRAILHRRNPAGGWELLRRLPTMNPHWQAILRQNHGRLTSTLRDAVLGPDLTMCRNGCRAAIWFREYDMVPGLLTALEDTSKPNSPVAAATLLELVEELYEELAGHRDPSDRRDPQTVRRHVVSSLELSVQRFGQHKCREPIEAFLLLVGHENVTLKQILQNPHLSAFLPMIETLSKSPRGGVQRLLLNFLEDPHAPSAVISVIGNRGDAKFVNHLLRKIGREPAAAVAQNLKRIESISWLRGGEQFLERLDDDAQHAVVRLVMTSGVPRAQAFATIGHLVLHGTPGGRREASRALAEFPGVDANALAMRALGDPDPQVQANIVVQLRGRGIPGVLPKLIELVDSPHEVVRQAAREGLAEFSFKRFLATFDLMEEDARRSTGLLVKKVDPQSASLLEEEMKLPVRTRRLRALEMARMMDLVAPVETAIVDLLQDEDHMVRMQAASCLGCATGRASREALQRALEDSSEVVRQAARSSLQEQSSASEPILETAASP